MSDASRRELLAIGLALPLAVAGRAHAAEVADAGGGLLQAIRRSSYPMRMAGGVFGGSGWSFIEQAAKGSDFVLLGEEHGVAEIPTFAGQLFDSLAARGDARLFIEVSDPAARMMDLALADGGVGRLARWIDGDAFGVAFYGWRQEAEFLARVRANAPRDRRVVYGTDYEPFATRRILEELERLAEHTPQAAMIAAVLDDALRRRADAAASRDVGRLLGFGGDPGPVDSIVRAWPSAPPAAKLLLETLRTTMEINRLFVGGQRWRSNQMRADFQRANFLRLYRGIRAERRSARVMMKYGANHLRRGLGDARVFDLGTLVPELAAAEGRRCLQVAVLAGRGSVHSVVDPASFRSMPQPATGATDYALDAFAEVAGDTATVFDLVSLRPVVNGAGGAGLDGRTSAVINGYDALVLLPHATAAGSL
ncbi:MAG: hypothetical protein E7773_14905 [Sphingomonas sp.]|uniref:hypothetical protein n=1 Tax=Sphingomonas sp. TaxID=28214 RepID=UPI00120A7F3A|nr:hypothetical protein [Sphingomonas sp.]THD34476.1 MAG: hypothetical protein E7773_14905 [Sphingomonas sp.]